MLAERQYVLACGPQALRAGLRIGQRDLEQGPLGRQRRTQLVRRVGDEPPLRLERLVQPLEQVVEGFREVPELVAPPGEPQPAVQVGGGDLPGRRGDGPQRPQEPAGDQPAEPERDHRHDHQADRGGGDDLRGDLRRRRTRLGAVRRRGHLHTQQGDAEQRRARDEERHGVQQGELDAQSRPAHHGSPIR